MSSPEYTWDFFIAHAGADKATAEEVFDYLESNSRVFLDSRRVILGDDWDALLPSSSVTTAGGTGVRQPRGRDFHEPSYAR
jgi:hypothetical protein